MDLSPYAAPVILSLAYGVIFLGLYGLLFIVLSRVFSGKPSQPVVHRGMIADALYWLLNLLLYNPIVLSVDMALLATFYSAGGSAELMLHGIGPLAHLPLWLQFLALLLVNDFLFYWYHRFMHRQKAIWKFHAIHHSSTHVDWLSSLRGHPLVVLPLALIDGSMLFLGFSPEALALFAAFSTLYFYAEHANLRWDFGPLRYVFVSPVYHRWHHTLLEEGGDSNFARIFPFYDKLFGTLYLPGGVQPQNFGTAEPVPEGFLGQLAYPFRRQKHGDEVRTQALLSTEPLAAD